MSSPVRVLLSMLCLFAYGPRALADPGAAAGTAGNVDPEVLRAIDGFLAAGSFVASYDRVEASEDGAADAPSLPRLTLAAVPTRQGFQVSAGSLSRLFFLSDAAVAAGARSRQPGAPAGSARVAVDDFSPFMMLGWTVAPPHSDVWSLSLSAGVAFADSASVERALACGSGLAEEVCAHLQAEAIADTVTTTDEFGRHDLFPLLSLGFLRRF